MLVKGKCGAQLLPPGDFNGTSFNQWGVNYSEWSLPLTLPGVVLPEPSSQDTVNGMRYLPTGSLEIRDFIANLTIDRGTALFGSPFFINGELYDDGHSDNPNDPLIETIFDETTLRVTLDGVVLLEGTASSLSARQFGPTYFTEPVPYLEPQQRGPDGSPLGQGLFAIGAAWTQGIGAMFANLPRGEHTLRMDFSSEFFGGAYLSTYHINVIPEPTSLMILGTALVGGLFPYRRRSHAVHARLAQ
jgi:hypothetical protein